MIEPTIISEVSGYRLEWGKENKIVAKVGSIHIHSRGHVTGELAIDSITPKGTINLLIPAQFNFSASRSRQAEANLLEKKSPNTNFDWHEIFDQLCQIILRASREGDPPLELWTGEGVIKPHYLVDPLIIENYPNVIFGDPGAMKSNFALVLITLLTLPWKDNPIGLIAPNKPVNCAYADWENESKTVLWQLDKLQRGHNLPMLALHYLKCSRPLSGEIERIQRYLSKQNITVLFIDSLGLAAGGKLNDTESPLEFYAYLRKLNNITSVILAHNAKDPETKKKSIYGSQFFTAGARNVWEIRKQQEFGSNEASVGLFHIKAPPFETMHHPLGFKFIADREKDTLSIHPADPKDIAEFVERMSLRTRILGELKSGAKSVEDLHASLEDIGDNALRIALSRLKSANKIVALERGKYGLPINKEYAQPI